MKNFVKGLITNRFGIVLAALNICYFVSHNPDSIRSLVNFDKLMISLNVPAAVLTVIPMTIIKFLFQMSYEFAYMQFGYTAFLFFVTFQWLFIGWMAKAVAQHIRPNQI